MKKHFLQRTLVAVSFLSVATLSAAGPPHIHALNLSANDLKAVESMAEEIVRKMTAEERASSRRPHMGANLVATLTANKVDGPAWIGLKHTNGIYGDFQRRVVLDHDPTGAWPTFGATEYSHMKKLKGVWFYMIVLLEFAAENPMMRTR